MDLTRGALVAGRYRAEKRVGAGGMGEVWSAVREEDGCKVALKTLLSAAALNHEVVARFRREALFLDKIRSEHVAHVLDFVTDDRYGLCLVMEFVEGESLASVLQKRCLSIEEAVDLACDVVDALCDLHRSKVI